jgi:CPA2 family monovalent cation:H+ antiporter-2
VGQTVAHLLELKGLSYVALEQDVLLVKRAQSFHNHIYFGDAMREPVLEAVGTERAAVAVVTLRDPVAASQCIAMLRKNFPRLHICARLMDIHNEEVLREAGADTIVPDEVEASLILAKLVATAAGADTEGHVLDEIRAKGYRFMDTLVNGEQETHRPRSNAPAPSKSRVRRKNTQKA